MKEFNLSIPVYQNPVTTKSADQYFDAAAINDQTKTELIVELHYDPIIAQQEAILRGSTLPPRG